MCLILFSFNTQPGFRLILAANRDEFYTRPTRPLSAWTDVPEVYGGRDLKEGGTWLGISRRGRLAALTNYRDPAHQFPQAPSRGLLINRFLTGDIPPADYLEQLQKTAHRYNGFNLLVGDQTGLWYYSNRSNGIVELQPGFYGLSNHLIDTEWPKVSQGKKRLKDLLNRSGGWEYRRPVRPFGGPCRRTGSGTAGHRCGSRMGTHALTSFHHQPELRDPVVDCAADRDLG